MPLVKLFPFVAFKSNPTEVVGFFCSFAANYTVFTKGYYKNTYTTSMAAYFLSVAPYGQAVKILKTHQKSLKKK